MSGHSKWSTIKRKKGAADATRGKVFTKLTREITLAARQGGGDPDMNIQLRLAVEKARQNNVPNETVLRAIKRGTGELDTGNLENFIYEAVGPGGTAFIIEGQTDNKQRTVSEMRQIFEEHKIKMAESGSQRWQFERLGNFIIRVDPEEKEKLELAAIEAGAEDLRQHSQGILIVTKPTELKNVYKKLIDQGYKADNPRVSNLAKNILKISDENIKKNLKVFLNELEGRDDIQNISVNFET